MSKKLSDETKNSPAFLYAKVRGLNNREAGRFSELFIETNDFVETINDNQACINSYLAFSREPNIDYNFYTSTDALGIQVLSRSKLVMAYEKQRKAYLKIKQLRHLKKHEVDGLMIKANPHCEYPNNMTYRTFVLQEILRHISAS